MIKLEKKQHQRIASLFSQHQYDTVILYTILEGYHGEAFVDDINNPTVARLDSGTFTILGGDPKSIHAKDLLHSKPIQFVTPETEDWRALLETEFKDSISQIEFTECYSSSINSNHLDDFINMMPTDYYIQAIDRVLAERIASEMDSDYFLEHFDSINDFLIRGIGYCILHNNQIVSAATSVAACQHAIDVEIKTNPDYQRTGLGTIIAASLVKGCLEKDIDPKWLAANDRSTRLAEKLGYTKGKSYITLMIGD